MLPTVLVVSGKQVILEELRFLPHFAFLIPRPFEHDGLRNYQQTKHRTIFRTWIIHNPLITPISYHKVIEFDTLNISTDGHDGHIREWCGNGHIFDFQMGKISLVISHNYECISDNHTQNGCSSVMVTDSDNHTRNGCSSVMVNDSINHTRNGCSSLMGKDFDNPIRNGYSSVVNIYSDNHV